MNLFLTGPAGFIGSAIRDLALAGGHSVAGLIRPEKGSNPPANLPEQMICVPGTLAAPPWQTIAKLAPEVCVHTAWITTPGVYLHSPENELHFEWGLNLLTRLADLGVKHVVVLGTCLEYRLGPEPLSEATTPPGPTTPYAYWKDALRVALEKELSGRDVTLSWARAFYPYGIGEHPARLCTSIIRSIAREETATLKTPYSTKDYIYIDDLARALLAVVEKRLPGAVNLGTGQGITVAQIAQTIAKLLGRPDLVRIADQLVPDEFACVLADSSRIRSLGWEPQVSLQEGLRRLITYLQS